MRLALGLAVLALAACQPAAKEAAAPAAEPIVPAPSIGPAPPPQFKSTAVRFDAKSKNATALTGFINLTALSATGPTDTASMHLDAEKGQSYDTDIIANGALAARHIDWTGVFGQVVDVDDQVLDIHAVTAETAGPGGYCGKDKTFALAVAFPIGVMNGAYMGIAAFKGDKWPPKDESQLCGVFNYSPSLAPPQ